MALPEANRLRSKKDIDRVFKEGNAVKGSFLLIKTVSNDLPVSRLGFIIPNKVFKNASARNRIKRVLSEAVRKERGLMSEGYDIVVLAVKKGEEENLQKELIKLLSKI